MTQSREKLVARALYELGVPGGGRTAEAADVQVANDALEPLLSDLSTREIWQWGDPDVIDDDAFLHLAKLLANSIGQGFGVPPDERIRMLAEQRLRELKPVVLSGQPQHASYF